MNKFTKNATLAPKALLKNVELHIISCFSITLIFIIQRLLHDRKQNYQLHQEK